MEIRSCMVSHVWYEITVTSPVSTDSILSGTRKVVVKGFGRRRVVRPGVTGLDNCRTFY